MENIFKDNLLAGKVAVITGGHGGMLYETAKTYLKFGATVVIMSRKEDKINEAVANLKKQSGSDKIWGTKCDVRIPKSIEDAIDKVLTTEKKIDILINGAAGNFLAGVDNLSYNAFKTVVEIDLMGTFFVSKVVWTKWMKQHGGCIINFSAGLYQNGTVLQSHAGAAKAGVDALTKHFCNEFGPRGVRVNSIIPGAIAETEGFARLLKPELAKLAVEVIPLQRNGSVKDIANACVFLASDAASYITGNVLYVDGGLCLTMPNFPVMDPDFRKAWIPPAKL